MATVFDRGRFVLAALAATVLTLGLTANAEEEGAAAQNVPALSYNSALLYVTRADVEDFEQDASGYALSASFEIGTMFHVWAEFQSGSVDHIYVLEIYPPIRMEVEIDARTFAIGGGFHHAVSDRASVYARAGLVQSNGQTDIRGGATVADHVADVGGGFPLVDQVAEILIDDFSADDDSTGYLIGGGFRFQAAPRIALSAGVSMFDVEDAGSTTAATVEAEFKVTDSIGLAGGFSFDDDVTGWAAGVVLRF